MHFKLAGFVALTMAASATALPQDSQSQKEVEDFKEKCGNNQLNCCSNLESTATGGDNIIDEVLGSIAAIVSTAIPISLLSGCAPLIGTHIPINLQTTLSVCS